MSANDVPFFYILDPSFLAFLMILVIGYGIWRLIEILRDR